MFKPICAQLPRGKKENLEPVIELAVEELWLLSHHNGQLRGPYMEELQGDIAVLIRAS